MEGGDSINTKITKEMWDELNEKYNELQKEYTSLKISEEIYREAIGLTGHIISVVDLQTHTTYQVHNEGRWATMTDEMPNAPESIIDTGIIHPDDVEEFRRYYRDMYEGKEKTGCVIRSHDDKRGWLWFHVYSKSIYAKDGTPLRAIAFSDNITNEKNAEFHYQQYKNVVTSDADSVWEVNLTYNETISEAEKYNELFNHHSKQSYSELAKIGAEYIVDDDDREYVLKTLSGENLIKVYNNAQREVSVDYRTDFGDGKGIRWMHVTAYLMANIRGEIIAIICSKDITALKEETGLLEERAEHDSLTGLANRFFLETNVEKIMETMPDKKHGFMIFDIDFFKSCNDNFGHSYGDDILCVLADVMRDVFRASDVLCRLGGDEFVVFLIGADSQSSVTNKSKELMMRLDEVNKEKNLKFPIKISGGLTISNPGESFQDIYVRMDAALYKSKKNGKNQFTFS